MSRTGIDTGTLHQLHDPTPREEIKRRQGPGGRMLDYVDARYVMDRLDTVVGSECWQDQYVDRANGTVRCGISILVDGEWVTKWDVGDVSDIEPDKGAYSEAFKRAGVKWGIARDLYGHAATTNGRGVSSPRPAPAPRPAAPTPSAGGAPEEPDYMREALDAFDGQVVDGPMHQRQMEALTRDGFCPNHQLAWVLKPGGVSKASGKAYDPFWACPSTDRPFCNAKPPKAWVAAHEVA